MPHRQEPPAVCRCWRLWFIRAQILRYRNLLFVCFADSGRSQWLHTSDNPAEAGDWGYWLSKTYRWSVLKSQGQQSPPQWLDPRVIAAGGSPRFTGLLHMSLHKVK